MAQGKLKVKTNVPNSGKNNKNKKKGNAVTARSRKPMQPKKHKSEEIHKLKKVITKTVNKAVEEEIRERSKTKTNLSKAQEAVVKHNQAPNS